MNKLDKANELQAKIKGIQHLLSHEYPFGKNKNGLLNTAYKWYVSLKGNNLKGRANCFIDEYYKLDKEDNQALSQYFHQKQERLTRELDSLFTKEHEGIDKP